MLGISLNSLPHSDLRILCLGAHSDDVEIGCGGTILRLIEDIPNLQVSWIVLGASGDRAVEARQSSEAFLTKVKQKDIIIRDFRDGFFPYRGEAIKEFFEQLKREITPDLIFTHYRDDLHQDHRLTSELTWNTFRDHLILEYEIPKYDGDLGTPNFYIPLDGEVCTRKIDLILSNFRTQVNRHWFTSDTFLSLLRLRGIEARSPGNYAEAFYCRKLVLTDGNLGNN
jgi:LmbE family N-acetylglucosaminyl deacetylase